jgi:hypothetical protein
MAKTVTATDHPLRIVVLDRGFVYIGNVEEQSDSIVITNAKNIRYWGTQKGLGELVNGPTSKTILDPVGVVRAPNRAIIHSVDVDESKWNKS